LKVGKGILDVDSSLNSLVEYRVRLLEIIIRSRSLIFPLGHMTDVRLVIMSTAGHHDDSWST